MPPTTSTSRRATTSWSSSCARKGAIIFAKAVNTEYNGRAGDPGGRHKPAKVLPSTLGHQRSTWAGNPANPYDTTRSASLGSSSGSALSVSINLVMASLGEETRASCRGPSNHNAVALILPHKAMLGFDGGAIGADIYCDRSGIHCRTLGDCAKVLDALKDPSRRLLRSARPVHHGAARLGARHALCEPRRARRARAARSQGIRLGVIRESMLVPPGSMTEVPIVTAAAREIKDVLGAHLGATLVESADPLWTPDPDLETMKTDFRRALARLVPVFMPDLLFRLGPDGQPVFRDFAAAIVPTRIHAGQDVRQRHDAADRLLRRARRRADRAADEPRSRHHPAAAARQHVPLPHLAISDAPQRGLAREGICRKLSTIGPR